MLIGARLSAYDTKNGWTFQCHNEYYISVALVHLRSRSKHGHKLFYHKRNRRPIHAALKQ